MSGGYYDRNLIVVRRKFLLRRLSKARSRYTELLTKGELYELDEMERVLEAKGLFEDDRHRTAEGPCLGRLVYDREMPEGASSERGCLCWVDVPASAKRAGYSAEWDAGDFKLRKD